MNDAKVISSKQLKSITPLLTFIIDGVKLYPHSKYPRPLLVTDEEEFESQKITKKDIITEQLYHVLYFLQNTALNLSGQQRVLLRTEDKQVIFVDPRLKVPDVFDDYLAMLHLLMEDRRVCSVEKGSEIMKFVKSDLTHSIPTGAKRIAAYLSKTDSVTSPDEFLKAEPTAVYIHLDPTVQSYDEVLLGKYCVSNDILSAVTLASRILHSMESKANLW
ncbi:hypothetical protein TVAG_312150 [Trichomonas vaginalis G3]|uniref:Uncharacterized protein n=1 Tax=Trichomonas vaginalis (strain ATCC PRA-98 / G3) TaxID=412133 RepID=A2EHM0_TRIV3|nr:alpha/beta knot family [Trichomonas vaginalis G3]EAY07816.1 hypothetical protein TVAG_312150 [Trichomonas vaginalis G3]KAI5553426.1 alpha/beta knot family [Trichomonas vaginalis G3]|eukprot:XP_001320039.1 hypothetical protein [Trichomonas vaginalis G3]